MYQWCAYVTLCEAFVEGYNANLFMAIGRQITKIASVLAMNVHPWSFVSIPLAVRRSEDDLIKIEVGCFAAQARVGFAVANGYDSALRIVGETERRVEIRFEE